MLTFVQIIGLIFMTFAASRAVLRAKENHISVGELFFWLAIWSGLIFVIFFPGVTSFFARQLGVGRGVDVIIYTSISLLFYLIFRLYVRAEETEKKITKLVRELAMKKK